MKCNQCGTEFTGKFCPECGAKGIETVQTPVETKKKKPFYLRWWFIVLAIIVLFSGYNSIKRAIEDRGDKIVWKDFVLGDVLPEAPGKRGTVLYNTLEDLYIQVNDISGKEYADYIATCRDMGYSVDEESSSMSFEAYNAEGYKLMLSHYGDGQPMSIQLEKAEELGTITWPTSTAGQLLPAPKSTIGKFSSEHDDNFFVYVGNTTKEDYAEYVNACSEKGFHVDFDKGETYYNANNAEGWNISVKYAGNNVMTISIKAPEEKKAEEPVVSAEVQKEEPKQEVVNNEPVVAPTVESQATASSNGLDDDFKAAMDSYEKFMDGYIAFMKKYKESNGTDLSILTDYAKWMSDYAKVCEEFASWESQDLSTEELSYYLEVQTRVTQKLLEVAY